MTPKTQAELDDEFYAPTNARLVAKHGEVPPPWAYYPRVHPFDIHWRMGGGEGYLLLFSSWLRSVGWQFEQRAAYVRRWDAPYSWLDWVASFLWPDDFSDDVWEPSEMHFTQMESLGLGTREDWSRCSAVEPEAYPLEDDISSRWLENEREPG